MSLPSARDWKNSLEGGEKRKKENEEVQELEEGRYAFRVRDWKNSLEGGEKRKKENEEVQGLEEERYAFRVTRII